MLYCTCKPYEQRHQVQLIVLAIEKEIREFVCDVAQYFNFKPFNEEWKDVQNKF